MRCVGFGKVWFRCCRLDVVMFVVVVFAAWVYLSAVCGLLGNKTSHVFVLFIAV